MTESIILHVMNEKIVTESLGTETNNFKPEIQLPARKRKLKFASFEIQAAIYKS